MQNQPVTVILASASPRRRELAALLPFRFAFRSPRCDEVLNPALSPAENAMELADAKAAAAGAGACVVGCDTIVVLDGRILGKPADEADAARMLRALSGRAHRVLTGVSVRANGNAARFCEETAVWFRALTDAEIAAYIATGEPMDKAGAYGIQGRAAHFVERIEGDYFNVVGLPLCRLYQALREAGIGEQA